MSIRVERNFGRLADIPLAGETLMREIGDLVLRKIRTRTEQGIDVDGRAFQPLSEPYRKRKQKEIGSSRADLTVSGRMLNDMAVTEVTKNRVTLGFKSQGGGSSGGTFIQRSRSLGAADKAYYHNETGAGKSGVKRRFFALSEKDEDDVQKAVDAYLDRVLGQ